MASIAREDELKTELVFYLHRRLKKGQFNELKKLVEEYDVVSPHYLEDCDSFPGLWKALEQRTVVKKGDFSFVAKCLQQLEMRLESEKVCDCEDEINRILDRPLNPRGRPHSEQPSDDQDLYVLRPAYQESTPQLPDRRSSWDEYKNKDFSKPGPQQPVPARGDIHGGIDPYQSAHTMHNVMPSGVPMPAQPVIIPVYCHETRCYRPFCFNPHSGQYYPADNDPMSIQRNPEESKLLVIQPPDNPSIKHRYCSPQEGRANPIQPRGGGSVYQRPVSNPASMKHPAESPSRPSGWHTGTEKEYIQISVGDAGSIESQSTPIKSIGTAHIQPPIDNPMSSIGGQRREYDLSELSFGDYPASMKLQTWQSGHFIGQGIHSHSPGVHPTPTERESGRSEGARYNVSQPTADETTSSKLQSGRFGGTETKPLQPSRGERSSEKLESGRFGDAIVEPSQQTAGDATSPKQEGGHFGEIGVDRFRSPAADMTESESERVGKTGTIETPEAKTIPFQPSSPDPASMKLFAESDILQNLTSQPSEDDPSSSKLVSGRFEEGKTKNPSQPSGGGPSPVKEGISADTSTSQPVEDENLSLSSLKLHSDDSYLRHEKEGK